MWKRDTIVFGVHGVEGRTRQWHDTAMHLLTLGKIPYHLPGPSIHESATLTFNIPGVMKLLHISLLVVNIGFGLAFQQLCREKSLMLSEPHFGTNDHDIVRPTQPLTSREHFLVQCASMVSVLVFAPSQPAVARGRATLDQAYDRYTPRIIAGGEFFKKDLRNLVARSDFNGIKRALQEPPKKSKADRAKPDGGATERASQAGGFSDARVLVAADLFAATFSDSSITEKTKKMQKEVEELRRIVQRMESVAKQALGEEESGGGLFGFGAKKASKDELSKELKDLYIQGGNAYNRYIFAANEGLPVQLAKLPFL